MGRRFIQFLAAALLVWGTQALAQSALPLNVFGKVTAIERGTVTIVQADGATRTYPLAAEPVVFRQRATTVAEIQPNDYVASAAEPRDDGTLHSTELRIFPERLRGVGEGQRPMNDPKKQIMTNATVTGPAALLGGDRIKVSFRGGDAILVIGKDVPVTRIEEAQFGDVKPDMQVRLQGTMDGAISRLTIQ